MGTSRRTLEKVTYVVTKINEILLLIAISIMFLLVFINVIGRYFLPTPYHGRQKFRVI